MEAAAEHIIFEGVEDPSGARKAYNLLESVKDPEAFSQVTDCVINEIVRSASQDRGMRDARKIVKRIHERKLYQCIIELPHAQTEYLTDRAEIKKLIEVDDDDISPDERIWKKENLVVEVSSFTYGMQTKNPFEHIPFYTKSHTDRDKAECLPEKKWPVDVPSDEDKIEDKTVRIYSRNLVTDDVLKKAREDFEKHHAQKIKLERNVPGTPTKQRSRQPSQAEEPEAAVSQVPKRNFSHPTDQSSM
ncbi:deoxynucleoside triphosphate triphosphohydrolase SAMHD1-like [Diadema antillarum]